jgi:arylsulfatase A-like enzyme
MNKPNIVVFLTDDHGHWTLPCYGNREVRAPSLSYLAETGTVMDAAYCPSPVCSPARACFYTGRFPSAHGIHDWIPEADDDGSFPHIDGMPGNIGERMREAGYTTALAGKYHCNHAGANPLGFDFWFTQKPPLGHGSFGKQQWHDNGGIVGTDGYLGTVITDAALRFLRERDRSKPFFLVVGHISTHTPHKDEPERLVAPYRGAAFGDIRREGFSGAHGRGRFLPRTDEADWREQTAQYYAAVSSIDEQVGRVLDALDDEGCADGTLVVYTSDHGHMNGQHGLHTKGNATVPVNFLEESVRVPLIFRGPGVPAGRRLDRFADHCDLYATLLDVAGAPAADAAPDGTRLPGRSYRAALEGGSVPAKALQFGEYGNARMVRDVRYKLIRRYKGPHGRCGDEFYDLESDPRERENRIGRAEYAAEVERLSAEIERFFATHAREDNSGLDLDNLRRLHSSSPWNLDPEDFPVIYQ